MQWSVKTRLKITQPHSYPLSGSQVTAVVSAMWEATLQLRQDRALPGTPSILLEACLPSANFLATFSSGRNPRWERSEKNARWERAERGTREACYLITRVVHTVAKLQPRQRSGQLRGAAEVSGWIAQLLPAFNPGNNAKSNSTPRARNNFCVGNRASTLCVYISCSIWLVAKGGGGGGVTENGK
jgi:hypothetical protein